MGWKSYSIEKVFDSRLRMWEHYKLPVEVKDVVDFTIIHNLKANPVLRLTRKKDLQIQSLWELRWTDIIELREALSTNDLVKAICLVYKIKPNQFNQLEIFNVYAVYLWIVTQFKVMMETEIEQLTLDLDDEEKQAGAEDLQDFGYVVALDGLAGGDILKYNDYLLIPYAKIFRKLVLDKTRYEINKNMQKNASRNATRNSQ